MSSWRYVRLGRSARSACSARSAGRLGFGALQRERFCQVVEIAVGLPGLAVADDIDAMAGPGDGDVEDVGGGGDPVAGFFAVGHGAEDEDDHLCLAALEGMDGAAFDAAFFLKFVLADLCDGAKGGDEEYFAFVGD